LLNKLKDLGVSPSIFVIDFESATKTATDTVFPHSVIQGCRFHLTQAWNRKTQQMGLAKQCITGESKVTKWLIHTYGLSFLRPKEGTASLMS
jgi:transposase-like protein